MERRAIKAPPEYTQTTYVTDVYTHDKLADDQKYLAPYYLDSGKYTTCYLPIKSISYRNSTVTLTHAIMQSCLANDVAIILEIKTDVPDWVLEYMSQVRGSLLIVQVPTMRSAQRSRFFKGSDSPSDMRKVMMKAFQHGVNIRLKIAPIVPFVTDVGEMVSYMFDIRSILKGVDIGFGRLTEFDVERIEHRNGLDTGQLRQFYTQYDGLYYLKDETQARIVKNLTAFCEGNKINLDVYGHKEIKEDD